MSLRTRLAGALVALLLMTEAGADVPAKERDTPAKKRDAPARVEPVSVAGVRYEALAFGRARGLGQNGGHILAVDEADGRELWIARVYAVAYDGVMEDDKQDVFITQLRATPDAAALLLEDERGRRWRFDLESRAASPD